MDFTIFNKRFTTTEKILFLTTLGETFDKLGFTPNYTQEKKSKKKTIFYLQGMQKKQILT